MSNLKIVDVNETTEQLPPEEPQNEPVSEQPHDVPEEIQNEPAPVKQPDPTPEEPKTVEKFKPVKDKMITCPKCGKYMLLKSYRYKHEKTCQGSIEGRPIRAKAKAEPKPVPKPVYQEEEKQYIPPVKNQIFKPPPVNPIASLTQHYQLLQQEYIKQKQEKYNNLCQNMFKSKPKKR
jgi:hypothetical protein